MPFLLERRLTLLDVITMRPKVIGGLEYPEAGSRNYGK